MNKALQAAAASKQVVTIELDILFGGTYDGVVTKDETTLDGWILLLWPVGHSKTFLTEDVICMVDGTGTEVHS
jgi:hypothetical protein